MTALTAEECRARLTGQEPLPNSDWIRVDDLWGRVEVHRFWVQRRQLAVVHPTAKGRFDVTDDGLSIRFEVQHGRWDCVMGLTFTAVLAGLSIYAFFAAAHAAAILGGIGSLSLAGATIGDLWRTRDDARFLSNRLASIVEGRTTKFCRVG